MEGAIEVFDGGGGVAEPRRLSNALAGSTRRGLHTHEIAYLRACVQGLDPVGAGERYLGVRGRVLLGAMHRSIVERARADARRSGDERWRLLPMRLPAAKPSAVVPSVEEWAAKRDLDGWSWAETLALYEEEVGTPPTSAAPAPAHPRVQRLLAQRLDLLTKLQLQSPDAQPSDRLDAWLEPDAAQALNAQGIHDLGGLREMIGRGGRWWRCIPACGRVKAQRIAHQVAMLLAHVSPKRQADGWDAAQALARLAELEAVPGLNRIAEGSARGTTARTDRQAVASWISSKAGSPATAHSYRRQAERFMLWAAHSRGCDLGSVSAEDCRAYCDFLAAIPADWITRTSVPYLAAGWKPFRGPMSKSSQHQAITVVAALFSWLVDARYLQTNPWALVNRSLGDDKRDANDLTTRALTPAAWAAVLAQLDDDEAAGVPSARRTRFAAVFIEATGVRSQELLLARRGDLRALNAAQPEGVWTMSVLGKGRKHRVVAVPAVAVNACRAYFASRGLEFDSAQASEHLIERVASMPQALVARGEATRELARCSASSLSGVVAAPPAATAFSARALRRSLKRAMLLAARRHLAHAPDEAAALARASTHWLRHTFGTRAAEREVQASIIQEQLGHADPRTAAHYSRSQIAHRAEVLARAWSGHKAGARRARPGSKPSA